MAAIVEIFTIIMCAISCGIFFSEKYSNTIRFISGAITSVGTIWLFLDLFEIINYEIILNYIVNFYKSVDKMLLLFTICAVIGVSFVSAGFDKDSFEGSISDPFIARGRIVSIAFGGLILFVTVVFMYNFMPRKTADDGITDAYIATEMNAADAMEGTTNDTMTAAEANTMNAAIDAMVAGADAMANAADPMTGTTNDSMTARSATGGARFEPTAPRAWALQPVSPSKTSPVAATANELPPGEMKK